MPFYQQKPKIIEAIQLNVDQQTPPSSATEVGEHIFHYCRENDEGFRWWVVGPHGKIFYIRHGDYAVRLPDDTWGVALQRGL